MATFDSDTLYGQQVKDADGAKLGQVAAVYADDRTDDPAWVAVPVGVLAGRVSIIPLINARYDENGDLRVPYRKGQIKDAPRFEGDDLTPAQEQELYDYYGVPAGETSPDPAQAQAAAAPSVEPVAADSPAPVADRPAPVADSPAPVAAAPVADRTADGPGARRAPTP